MCYIWIDKKHVGHLLKILYEWIHIAVIWLKYCPCGIKHNAITQSIKHLLHMFMVPVVFGFILPWSEKITWHYYIIDSAEQFHIILSFQSHLRLLKHFRIMSMANIITTDNNKTKAACKKMFSEKKLNLAILIVTSQLPS